MRSIIGYKTPPHFRSLTDKVRALFANGEQGGWYDPSDFSTMFQDAAGSIPVTAVGQSVGLILDKRLGLERGPELVTNGDFSAGGTGWTIMGAGVSIASGKATWSSAVANERITQGALSPAKFYEVTYTVSGYVSGAVYPVGSPTPNTGTANGTFKCIVTGATSIYMRSGGAGFTGSVDDISYRELPGNHASQVNASNKPILGIDGNGKYYLAFDGVDDSLSTRSIDFTSTDKMTVVAGVRKLSDATIGCVAELDVGTTGLNAFRLQFPEGAGSPNATFASGGSSAVQAVAVVGAAPFSAVLTGVGDIAGDLCRLRANGVQIAQNTGDQGTGTYGNKPIFIGRRNGSSQPFNGHLYSLVVRGALTTDLAPVETYVADKTGVTLP